MSNNGSQDSTMALCGLSVRAHGHPRAHVHLAAIGAAQGGLISIVGTADLSLEDYAVPLLRLIGSRLLNTACLTQIT